MLLLLAFGVSLLAAVLVSGLAERTVLSTAVLFLIAGFLSGVILHADVRGFLGPFAEIALVTVLFTDALRLPLAELRHGWRLPGRALLLGLPLTVAGNALAARLTVGIDWGAAFLVGAALAPTDPVLAAAIVGAEEVPARLRHLLNVESGLNDGLALPVVVTLLATLAPHEVNGARVAAEVLLGVALGVAVPLVAIRLEQSRFFGAAALYEPLSAVAIGVLVYAVARATGTNAFLAEFAAGVTIASAAPRVTRAFSRFGELVTELAKLAAIFVFGAIVSPRLLSEVPLAGYLFALLVLVGVRPVALAVALLGGGLRWREWVTAAWFGPKGFSSVVYGLLILASGLPRARDLAHLIAVAVAASIVAHSSTDVLVARWFRRAERAEARARA